MLPLTTTPPTADNVHGSGHGPLPGSLPRGATAVGRRREQEARRKGRRRKANGHAATAASAHTCLIGLLAWLDDETAPVKMASDRRE